MAEVVRLVCDRCQSMDGVSSWRLSTPETGPTRALALDLCKSCAAPLEEFSTFGRAVSSPRRRTAPGFRPGRGGDPLRSKVYTQEELDEIEKAGEA